MLALFFHVDHVLHVVRAFQDASRRQQQPAHDKFFHRVRVRPGRVKHRNTSLTHLFHRNVVRPRAASHDRSNRRFHFVHLQLVRAKHDRHRRTGQIRLFAGNFILPLRELFQTRRGNRVKCFHVKRRA